MLSSFLRPYRVKAIFYTLQGEGFHTGRAAVFCRFAGCNLWSGHERDRAKAICQFCDTDFVGGQTVRHPGQLATAIRQRWRGGGRPFVVLTGGEPTLQVDERLLFELRVLGCDIAMETNGTQVAPKGCWLTVSPKAGSTVVQTSGDELKVVWPQPLDLDELASWRFAHRFLQPMDSREGSVTATVQACLADPRWRLSLQTHKILGID